MQRQGPRRIEARKINYSTVLLVSSHTTATEDSVSAIPHSLPGPVRGWGYALARREIMKLSRTTGIMAWAGAGPFWGLLGAVLAIQLLVGPVGAQQTSVQAGGELAVKTVRQIEALLAAKAQRTPAQRKVSSQLLPARQAQGYSVARLQAPVEAAADETVMVDIRADVTPEVLARIRVLGGTVINSVPRYRVIRAQLPLAAVEPLAILDAVQTIRPADEAATRAQATWFPSDIRPDTLKTAVTRADDTSEGDVAHQADLARTTHGVDGAGIGIGVLSNGVATLAARQASGDLPDRVTVLSGEAGRGDEGTAMLEIVHDLAPGAELYFATAFGGQARFAANIEALCDAGANVIVDDVYYFREAAFQDDVVAKGVNTAVADGCVFVSAGSNGGNKNDGTAGVWEGDYAAGSSLTVNGVAVGVAHDFGGGVIRNRITEDSRLAYVLQWADPLEGSANDYDLFLVDENDNVLKSSTNTQDGTQDPIELIISSEEDHTGDRLVIVKTAGAADRYLRLDTLEGRLAVATEGNLFGHSAAENAVSVAAVGVQTAGGAGGVFNGTESVRTSNSDGPRRIFFQPDGTPITAGNFSSTGGKLLQKPDLAAATCVSTSTPGFSPFCGVSSAAPHAAAIAALMLEAAGGPGNVTPAALRTAMTGASLDIEATGTDRDSGAGIVMAPGAVDAVDVAVADRNQAPEVEGTLADRTMIRGAAAVTVNVASAFSDPDNDTLTYTALSSDPDLVEVSLTGSMLALTPGLPGLAVVTVRATDPGGLSAVRSFLVTVALGNRDYDVDDDGLIEVGNLAQFDAVRYDLNGDGLVDDASDWQSYYAAFAQSSLTGCPGGCTGYELTASLDFDTNNSGAADAGDDYWNGGEGWVPIGGEASLAIGTLLLLRNPFTAIFEGNGHTVSNLFIDTDNVVLVGLFGLTSSSIRNVGVTDVDVTGTELAAGLVGFNAGEIRASYVTGRVSGKENVGGLVGINQSNGEILASYATSHVSGEEDAGGLVGDNRGKITAGYATGRVSGEKNVGGLVGFNQSTGEIDSGYSTGRVTGDSDVGGLVGSNEGAVTVSYWDTSTSGHTTGSFGEGKTTAQLQAPTDSNGIYQSWNLDLDSDQVNDWHFGTAGQYPALNANVDGQGQATWQEFGYQLREGPTLTVMPGPTQIVLSWTAVEANHWTPAPGVAYTLTRDDGAASKTLGENLSSLTFTDTDVTAGITYTYQVAAVVTGGEATRSARVSVTVPGTIIPLPPPPLPPPPPPIIVLPPPPPPPQANSSPTADAGPDQLGVWEGALVTLDGSGSSDPDGDPLRYRWNQYSGERVELSSQNVVNPTFTAPEGLTADAVLRFRLLVTDPSGRFDSDTVTVTVDPDAEPPPAPPMEDRIYYFPHLAVGAGWQTTITYINYSPEEVTCRTDFLSDDGTPLMVSFADRGTVPNRTDVLQPGESVHEETNVALSAPRVAGWARAACSGPVKASLLFRFYDSAGEPTGEAGVNATAVPATRFVTFAEQGEDQPGTGVAYANPSDTEAVITFTVRDADGEVLASDDLMLSPNGHGAQNMQPLFGLTSFTGSLEITSTEPIVSLSLNAEAAPVFSSLPPGEPDAAAQGPQQMTTYYFPHLAVGKGWQTTITYINYTPQEVSCRTEFLSDHGSPLLVSFAGRGMVVNRDDVLPPGGSVHEETNVELSALLAPGWARAACSGPVKASLLYRRFEGGVPTGEAGVNATTVPATRFVTFAEQGEGQFGTAVAYANPSSTAALVTFTARDADGKMLASFDQTLLTNGHDAQNVKDLFGLTSFTGSLEITSTEPIVSLSINAEADPVFSSLPPGELE